MQRKTRWLAVFLSLALFGLVLSACQQSASLKLNLKVGDTFAVHSAVSQDMSQELMGQPMYIKQNLVFDYTWKVTDVDAEGNATIQVTYDHIAIEQTQNGQKVAYDSASDETPPKFFTGVDAMVGKSYTMVLAPTGKLKDVQGLEELFQEVTDATDLDDLQKKSFYQALVETFGEEAINEQVDMLFGQYGSAPLEVGATWEADTEYNALFPLQVHTQYTIKSLEDGKAVIALDATLKSDPEKIVDDASRIFKLSYELMGTQEGTMTVNTANGMPTESHVTQHLEGKLYVVNVDTGEKMPIPMSMDSDIQLSVTQK
ncbi:MAG: hypothetical protein GXO56_07210 [Chloroflexi bacterium]|nr:hypothetical protein [Chloroflexota bacterium]